MSGHLSEVWRKSGPRSTSPTLSTNVLQPQTGERSIKFWDGPNPTAFNLKDVEGVWAAVSKPQPWDETILGVWIGSVSSKWKCRTDRPLPEMVCCSYFEEWRHTKYWKHAYFHPSQICNSGSFSLINTKIIWNVLCFSNFVTFVQISCFRSWKIPKVSQTKCRHLHMLSLL